MTTDAIATDVVAIASSTSVTIYPHGRLLDNLASNQHKHLNHRQYSNYTTTSYDFQHSYRQLKLLRRLVLASASSVDPGALQICGEIHVQ